MEANPSSTPSRWAPLRRLSTPKIALYSTLAYGLCSFTTYKRWGRITYLAHIALYNLHAVPLQIGAKKRYIELIEKYQEITADPSEKPDPNSQPPAPQNNTQEPSSIFSFLHTRLIQPWTQWWDPSSPHLLKEQAKTTALLTGLYLKNGKPLPFSNKGNNQLNESLFDVGEINKNIMKSNSKALFYTLLGFLPYLILFKGLKRKIKRHFYLPPLHRAWDVHPLLKRSIWINPNV